MYSRRLKSNRCYHLNSEWRTQHQPIVEVSVVDLATVVAAAVADAEVRLDTFYLDFFEPGLKIVVGRFS